MAAARVTVDGVEYVRADLVDAVVGYWDTLEGVPPDDPRPTTEFYDELSKRLDALRP